MADTRSSIDYGPSSYGECIRFYTRDESTLHGLKKMFQELAAGISVSVEVISMFGWIPSGITSLTATCLDGEPPLHFRFAPTPEEPDGHWIWRGYRGNWQRCEELIDGMFIHGGPCHQYLGELDTQDVFVEISFCE